MTNEAYEYYIVDLFSSGRATHEQWHEMATAIKLISDDFMLRDLVAEIDAVVRASSRDPGTRPMPTLH